LKGAGAGDANAGSRAFAQALEAAVRAGAVDFRGIADPVSLLLNGPVFALTGLDRAYYQGVPVTDPYPVQ